MSPATTSPGRPTRTIAEWHAEAERQRQLMNEANARGEYVDDADYLRALDGLPRDLADAAALLRHLHYLAEGDGRPSDETVRSIAQRVLLVIERPGAAAGPVSRQTMPATDTEVMAIARRFKALDDAHAEADEQMIAAEAGSVEHGRAEAAMDEAADKIDAYRAIIGLMASHGIVDAAIQVMLAADEIDPIGREGALESAKERAQRATRHLNSALAALVDEGGLDLVPFGGHRFCARLPVPAAKVTP